MSVDGNIVTQYLIQSVNQQLHEHHVVVWFDPEMQYKAIARAENFPNTHFFLYDSQKGFLSLRRDLEEVWGGFESPQLLIYVPISEEKSHHALIEYSIAGVIMQPGQQPIECNTRLSTIAKQALNGILPSINLTKVIAEVENGQLSLENLDEIANSHKEIHIGALALIFKSENIEDICLQFIASTDFDEEINAKNALKTLINLVKNELEIPIAENFDIGRVRETLSRYLLLGEFTSYLGKSLPPSLSTFKGAKSKSAIETMRHLVTEWRLRSDYSSSYLVAANKIESDLGLSNYTWSIDLLENVETFSGIDPILQSMIEKLVKEKPAPSLLEIAQKRQNGYWSNQNPAMKLHWQVIIESGQVLIQTINIKNALKQDWSAVQLINNYSEGQSERSKDTNPWCKLDTLYRRLERDEHNFDFETDQDDSLQKLLAAARVAYTEIADHLTEKFIGAFEKAKFNIPEIMQQVNLFHDFVEPSLETGKTAYVLVDAFRYEMALDLINQIQSEWNCHLSPALATPPTITEVGMAALMPGAEKGIAITSGAPGKLGTLVMNTLLKGKPDRMKFIETNFPQSVVLDLNQIVPLKDKKVIETIEKAKLLIVTVSDEIDGLWESQPEIARRLHDDVFTQLRRCIRNLFTAGVQKIIITSDHGFIAGDNLMTGTPIDPPGGETLDLHRRVWIGRGGSEIATCLRKPISVFGIGGDVDLVTPMGFGCFKAAGGSNQYYHGGLSLQEIIIPILTVQPGQEYPSSTKEPAFLWELKLGSNQITTRFFSVIISGNATDLYAVPPKVRVEMKYGNQIFSTPVASSYGFQDTTKDIEMKREEGSTTLAANTVTLFIADPPREISAVDLYLMNSDSGLVLSQIKNISVAISL